jgi:hypothetical protein
MHIPMAPPDVWATIESQAANSRWFERLRDPDVVEFVRRSNDGYVHWHKLRFYQRLPDGFDAAMSWAVIALSRFQQHQALPIQFNGSHLIYWIPP